MSLSLELIHAAGTASGNMIDIVPQDVPAERDDGRDEEGQGRKHADVERIRGECTGKEEVAGYVLDSCSDAPGHDEHEHWGSKALNALDRY